MDDDTPIILRNQSRLPKRRKIISEDEEPTSSPQVSANLTSSTFEDDLRAAIAICEELDRNESRSQPFQTYSLPSSSLPPPQLVRSGTPPRNGRIRSRPSSYSYSTSSPPAHASLAPTVDVLSPQLESADFDFGGDDSSQSQLSQQFSHELASPSPTPPKHSRAHPPTHARLRSRPRSPSLNDSPCPHTPHARTERERAAVAAVSSSLAASATSSAASSLAADSAMSFSSSSSSSAPSSLTASTTSSLSPTRSTHAHSPPLSPHAHTTPADSHTSPAQSSHLSPTPSRAHVPSTPSRNDLRALSRHASFSATPAHTHMHTRTPRTAPNGLQPRSSLLVSPFFTDRAHGGLPSAAQTADVSEVPVAAPSSLVTRSTALRPTTPTTASTSASATPAHASADPLDAWRALAFDADADAAGAEPFSMGADVGDPAVDTVLQCGICLEPITEPAVPAACTHACCYACLLTWFSASSTCPLCTAQVDYIHLYPARALEAYVRSRHELGRPLGRRDARGQPVGEITPPPSPLRGETVSYVKQRTMEYIEDQLLAVPSAVEERLEQTVCVVCGSGDDGDGADPLMDLLLCDGDGGACTRAMHVRCHLPERLTSVPPGNWYCDEHRAHDSYAHPRPSPRSSGRRRRHARLVETDSESESGSGSSDSDSSDVSELDVTPPHPHASSRRRVQRRAPATFSPAPTVARWVSVAQSGRAGASTEQFGTILPTRRVAPASQPARIHANASVPAPVPPAAPTVPRHERLRAQAQAGRTPNQWLADSHNNDFSVSFDGARASSSSFPSSSLFSTPRYSTATAPARAPSPPSRGPYTISSSHVYPVRAAASSQAGAGGGNAATVVPTAAPRSNLYRRSHAAPATTTAASASASRAPNSGQSSSSGPTLVRSSFASIASHSVFTDARARPATPGSTGTSSSFFSNPNTARTTSTTTLSNATGVLVSTGNSTSAAPVRATHLYARRRAALTANTTPAPAGSRLAAVEQRRRDMDADFAAALPPSQRGTNIGANVHRWLG